ncbi:hypothetical protein ACIQOU_15580 [Streptomyces sp. NPDC091279]|uniref:hypothetical protein n=1 Tax=Streptomyces sp. NPDC091279 TaxID=3365983 RepID=UPI0038082DFC
MPLTASENTAVAADLLHRTSRRHIVRAVERRWPDKEIVLGPQHPSVTSYVCRVTVNGEDLIAKYSWLGLSLVSILRGVAPIGERSVVGVFRRKFNGLSTAGRLRTLGQDSRLPEHERQEVAELVRTAAWRLLRMAGAISTRRDLLVFGDLKPEHVHIDGPHLNFIDPAVQWAAGPQPDIAKLTGRAVLLAVGHPDRSAGSQIVQGVAATLARYLAALPEHERAGQLREIMVLWLMDTVSILSTCLSAPQGLLLTPHQQSLVERARTVAGFVDRASALLVGSSGCCWPGTRGCRRTGCMATSSASTVTARSSARRRRPSTATRSPSRCGRSSTNSTSGRR